MIRRRKFRTPRGRKQERIRIITRSVVFTLVVLMCIYGIVSILRLEKFRIQRFSIENQGGVLSTSTVETVLKNKLSGVFFLGVPKDSTLFVNIARLEHFLQDAYPRIQQVIIRRESTHALSVRITERTPVALWCGDVVPPIAYASSSTHVSNEHWGTCYLLDRDGYIYAQAPTYTGNPFYHYYGALKKATPVGQYFVAPEEFHTWNTFFDNLEKKDIHIVGMLFVNERDVELYLEQRTRIYVARDTNMDDLYKKLVATVRGIEQQNKTLSSVAYIDLRFGNKGFIRYRK